MQEKIDNFLEEHDIAPKKQSARSYIFDCPACGGKEKLYIEKSNGRSICFKHKTEECPTARTSIARVLTLISGLPFEQVKNELTDIVTTNQEEKIVVKDTTQTTQNETEKIQPIKTSDLPIDARLISWKESEEGLNYLLGRGLDIDTLKKQGIMYSPSLRRVIFPVVMNNAIYGWQGRSIDKTNPLRMYNLPGPWKTQTLLFYDNLKNNEYAIIAEGAVSALKFAQVGGYVATMGKMVSTSQINLILESGVKKIYLALDPDAVEEMEILVRKLLSQINYQVKCFLVKVPDGKEDFGDCSYQECKEAFDQAEPLDLDCSNLYAYLMEKL